MTEQQEIELIRSCLNGDPDAANAFENILERYTKLLESDSHRKQQDASG